METYATCPFFVCKSKNTREHITITCENPEFNMGFDMLSQLRFLKKRDREDWFEIFCADCFQTCPYYRRIMEKYDRAERKQLREKRAPKMRTCARTRGIVETEKRRGINESPEGKKQRDAGGKQSHGGPDQET